MNIYKNFMIFLLLDKSQCNSKHEVCLIVAENLQRDIDGEKINWKIIERKLADIVDQDAEIVTHDHPIACISWDIAYHVLNNDWDLKNICQEIYRISENPELTIKMQLKKLLELIIEIIG